MELITGIEELRARLDVERGAGRRIGFVPTMGYLHEGHLSLARRAAELADVVLVSIFVNPLQFAPTDDLEAYPRDLERDAAACAGVGVDLVFAPGVDEMYPAGQMSTTVSVAGPIGERLEGRHRPGHFDGVATVVTKLLSIVGPCVACFGDKDFQQLALVRRMSAELSLPVEVVGCPIVRESDGLAMSSRNVYLEPEERAVAGILNSALRHGVELIEAGERDPDRVESAMAEVLAAEPRFQPDYLAVVDAETFERPERLAGSLRLLGAAQLGRARLIDNLGVVLVD